MSESGLFWEALKIEQIFFQLQVQPFALTNTKQPCDWMRPQLGRQQRELTKLIRRGWHVKVSCGSGVDSITYVSFVVGEVAPLFVNWWRFALPSLWVEALTCGGPDRERRLFSFFFFVSPDACSSSCPTPSQTYTFLEPWSHTEMGNTCKRQDTPSAQAPQLSLPTCYCALWATQLKRSFCASQHGTYWYK